MSNVLIGVIGVVLFIGLALAGALFLGPRFQESSRTSRAAAKIQMMSQMVSAAELYMIDDSNLQVGGFQLRHLKAQGYIKEIPLAEGGSAALAFTGEGAYSPIEGNSRELCVEINRQLTGDTTIPAMEMAPAGPPCCVEFPAGSYQLTKRMVP